jgi:hypothetical protein
MPRRRSAIADRNVTGRCIDLRHRRITHPHRAAGRRPRYKKASRRPPAASTPAPVRRIFGLEPSYGLSATGVGLHVRRHAGTGRLLANRAAAGGFSCPAHRSGGSRLSSASVPPCGYGYSGISQVLLGQWLGLQQFQVSRVETGPPIGIPACMLWFDLPKETLWEH